jgi:hypothetical protein
MAQIDIAMDEEAKRRKKAMSQIQPMQGPQHQKTAPSTMELAGDMIKSRAMERGLDKGEELVTSGITSGATAGVPTFAQSAALTQAASPGMGVAPGAAQAILGSGKAAAPMVAKTAGMSGMGAGATAAGASSMAALGAAIPYIGMGMAAGKLLGFFSGGGYVGPLASAQYKSAGGETVKLNYGGPLAKGE